MRRSVFWKVAGILVGVQVATGLVAVTLSAWLAYEHSLDLVANSLRLRLDGVAEEVEQRAGTLTEGLDDISLPLRQDLARRFPDPVILLDPAGVPLETIPPDPAFFEEAGAPTIQPPVPRSLDSLLATGEIVVQADRSAPGGSWAAAPVYDRDGFLTGGLLVQPLDFSIRRELAGSRRAFFRALVVVVVLAGFTALLLGAFFTVRLLKPLRRVMHQVERIGAGDYDVRIETDHEDEFGRLATAVNRMAAAVAHSVETLRATDRLRRELIANVGHDLRTPLAALRGYLEEASRYLEKGDREAAREALTTAESQGKYLTRLVEDLFELSLLDSAQPPLRREPIPLAELLNDAARAHRAAFSKEGITFDVVLSSDLPVIEGDGVRLLRVLDNLLANARRHTPAEGAVTLCAAVEGDLVRVEVRDTGPGMEAGVLDHIFERYYRGEDARTRRGSGTGLGLPISRAIARAHGGDLTATSIPGEGSTFVLSLPAHQRKELPSDVT